MSTPPNPASPDQVRLLIGLSCLTSLPLLGLVVIYVTAHQAAADQRPAWWAFGIALAIGAVMGLVLVRLVPFFGGAAPALAPGKAAPALFPMVALVVVFVIGRLINHAVPVTTGFIAGSDALLAAVLLPRSLRALSGTTRPPR